MKTIEIRRHLSGLYSDPNLVKSYERVLDDVVDFIPESSSYGNLSLKGNGAMALAKAKTLKRDVENLIDIVDALVIGRK